MDSHQLTPGHAIPLCRTCRHFDAYMYDQGHPQPCNKVAWHGHQHYSPTLTVDADGVVQCGDHQAVGAPEGVA